MSSAYGTKLAEGFSAKIQKNLYDKSQFEVVTNRDYEGDINSVGSKLNIFNLANISEKTYADAAMSADSLYENNAQLVIDQYKSFYWKEKVLARWLSYIKNPHATVVNQVANERNKNIEEYIYGRYSDIGAGNRVGTDYTTGSVTVDVTTGVVTGDGTTFTEAMEGRPFKADGHTSWYRVKDFTNTTSMTIEDDLDDTTSAYTGGAIGAGATYTVQAATVLAITTTTLLQYVAKLKQVLDEAEAEGHSTVPDTDRYLIVPPVFENLLVRASGVALHVPAVYEELVKRGFITELLGFKVFKSNRLTGDNTDGYRVLAGHPNWMTFAEKTLNARMEEDLIGDFGTAFKDLFVYGQKVTDARRHQAAELFATFTV